MLNEIEQVTFQSFDGGNVNFQTLCNLFKLV